MIEISLETKKRIQLLYPANQIAEVESYLREKCGDNLPLVASDYIEHTERIRFAVLKLSCGDYRLLIKAVENAAIDWRDTLMIARFGEDAKAHLSWVPEELLRNR